GVGGEQAGNQVEERRLAGAVRADDGMESSAGEAEAQVVDSGQAAEAFGGLFCSRDRFAHGSVRNLVSTAAAGSRSVSRRSHSRHNPTMPLGPQLNTRIARLAARRAQ